MLKANQFSGGNSEWEPPDPFSNSEVKTLSADGSVGSPHVRVGHRQDFNFKPLNRMVQGLLFIEPAKYPMVFPQAGWGAGLPGPGSETTATIIWLNVSKKQHFLRLYRHL